GSRGPMTKVVTDAASVIPTIRHCEEKRALPRANKSLTTSHVRRCRVADKGGVAHASSPDTPASSDRTDCRAGIGPDGTVDDERVRHRRATAAGRFHDTGR